MGEKSHILEARELVRKINNAITALSFTEDEFTEDEVRYRLDSLRGTLIFAHNDARQMLKEWGQDHD